MAVVPAVTSRSTSCLFKTTTTIFIIITVGFIFISAISSPVNASLSSSSSSNLMDPELGITTSQKKEFTNEFAVHLDGGHNEADRIATKYGFVNKGQIGSLCGHYLFEHSNIAKRSIDYSHEHHLLLRSEPQVHWVEQQHVKKRRKRDDLDEGLPYYQTASSLSPFSKAGSYKKVQVTDPLYSEQWYLNNGARGGYDMNVAGAWAKGYTGKRVVVTILDDGIQTDHPDLVLNYDPRASSDINDNDSDPTPQDNNDNKHGTRCAGEVAAQAFNEFCGVGIAYNASIGGVRMLDGTVTDQVEARALSLNPDHIDIYSASWGPEDDGKTVDGPGRLTKRAFIEGIRKGRNGLGSIFVWASGNGGRKQDNCNCDGYTNSIYTLSISSATQSGAKPWYLEECSSTLATTYSSGTPGIDQNIVTVDMDTTYAKTLAIGDPVTTYLCTLSHTGTSASAPIAAGICALALEANRRLSWRDMQHLVVATSRPEPLRWESGWLINGVGRKYSHKFGYGLMNAEAMVRLAEVWTPVPVQRFCESQPMTKIMPIPVSGSLTVQMPVTGCVGENNEIRYLEHVQARLTIKFRPRGNLRITLFSPSGTASTLLSPRIRDEFEDTFSDWPFLSVHFWGENPSGVWKLRIENSNIRSSQAGSLIHWTMAFYGTYDRPETLNSLLKSNSSSTMNPHYLPRRTKESSTTSISNECAKSGLFQNESGDCVNKCPTGTFADNEKWMCTKCDSRCKSCYGPHQEHCLSCPNGSYYYGDRCVKLCPDTHYPDARINECLPCSSNCASCHLSPHICKSCSSKLLLNKTTSRCEPACQVSPGKTTDSSLQKIDSCQCHASCLTCTGPNKNQCLSCKSSHRLWMGQCISEYCPSGFYEESFECHKCHSSCRTCSGPAHTQCMDCSIDHNLNSDGICSKCPPGHYLNRAVEIPTCSPCYSQCSDCNGPNEDDCTHCDSPLNLFAGRCVPCCDLMQQKRLVSDKIENISYSSHNNSLASNDSVLNRSDEFVFSNEIETECCTCFNSVGPCLNQEHVRSVTNGVVELEQMDDDPKIEGKINGTLFTGRTSIVLLLLLCFIAITGFLVLNHKSRRKSREFFLRRSHSVSSGGSSRFSHMIPFSTFGGQNNKSSNFSDTRYERFCLSRHQRQQQQHQSTTRMDEEEELLFERM